MDAEALGRRWMVWGMLQLPVRVWEGFCHDGCGIGGEDDPEFRMSDVMASPKPVVTDTGVSASLGAISRRQLANLYVVWR